jgi:hypothetical protein
MVDVGELAMIQNYHILILLIVPSPKEEEQNISTQELIDLM